MSEVNVVSPMVEELFSDAAAIGFVEVVEVETRKNGYWQSGVWIADEDRKPSRYIAPASCRNAFDRVVVEDDGDILWAK